MQLDVRSRRAIALKVKQSFCWFRVLFVNLSIDPILEFPMPRINNLFFCDFQNKQIRTSVHMILDAFFRHEWNLVTF